ncbi:hypothetical protein [Fusobacterium sp. PH5-44]|uniref:hypothetical protein n=1 Tax=unclassified Fusobacterium TaxID=2648384 RepID=UPI003D1D2DD0
MSNNEENHNVPKETNKSDEQPSVDTESKPIGKPDANELPELPKITAEIRFGLEGIGGDIWEKKEDEN